MLHRVALVVLVLFCAVAVSSAQSFANLNFEQAVVEPSDPMFGYLDWDLAAPGWSHSAGADTGTVYYGRTHVGLSQWFLLVDRNNTSFQPLSGAYSLAFRSGYYESWDATPWVNASIFQRGLIPSTARSVCFMATGSFGVSVNGFSRPTYGVGLNTYAVDVSGWAGRVAELKFTNLMQPDAEWEWINKAVLVDNISFSSTPVAPEPAGLLALSMGLLALIHVRRRMG